MSVKEEIDLAIQSHEQWKKTLQQAVDTGVCRTPPDEIREDGNCQFGKWLYSRFDDFDQSAPHFNTVVNLHAEFHQEAAEVLKMAMHGRRPQARERLQGPYREISEKLIGKMTEWAQSLGEDETA